MYREFADAKVVVLEADLATRVAVPVVSLKVYKPNLIKEVPVVTVAAEATLIEFTFTPHIGPKNVK